MKVVSHFLWGGGDNSHFLWVVSLATSLAKLVPCYVLNQKPRTNRGLLYLDTLRPLINSALTMLQTLQIRAFI